MKRLVKLLSSCLVFFVFISCGNVSKQSKIADERSSSNSDSSVWHIALMPTLDCLPFYVAQSEHIFDKFGLKVSLRLYTSQMDCDTALLRERVAISVSDMIRAEGLKKKGMHLDYLTGTDTYWQLITNKASRVQSVNQLGDKMIGITRFSATQTLLEKALEDGRLSNHAYPIQVNDVSIRLEMLKNKSIDAALLTEPQASIARKLGHVVIFDSRTNDYRFGVFVVNHKFAKPKLSRKELDNMMLAYNAACDSINKRGFQHYSSLLSQHFRLSNSEISSLPKLRFSHASPPKSL